MRISDWSSDVCSFDLAEMDSGVGETGQLAIARIDRRHAEERQPFDRNERAGFHRVEVLIDDPLFARIIGADEPFETVAFGRLKTHFLREALHSGQLALKKVVRRS